MADQASRNLPARARHGAHVLVVLLGLALAMVVPAVVLAATGSGTAAGAIERGNVEAQPLAAVTRSAASGARVAVVQAGTDATPAPAATPKPGEPGTADTAGWDPATPDPFASLAPLMLGAVVLVILVVFIAMSFREPAEA